MRNIVQIELTAVKSYLNKESIWLLFFNLPIFRKILVCYTEFNFLKSTKNDPEMKQLSSRDANHTIVVKTG